MKERFRSSFREVKPATIIKWAVILVLFLVITNPALIPFLPNDAKVAIRNTWGSLFGDVSQVSKAITISWVTLFRVIAIILLMIVITTLAAFILEHIKPKTGKGASALSLVRSALSYITTFITILWCLHAIGVNVSTLAAGVGIIALGISFGAQSLVEDVVTGIFLVFEDEFNVGDIIEVDGFRGTVESIGIRVTSIKGVGGNVRIINNSDLRNVLNRSAATSFAVTEVSVAYGEDVEKVEKVLADLMPKIRAKYPEVFLEDPQNLGVSSLGDSGVVFKIGGSVHEKDIFSAPRLLNREIKIAFDEAGVEIPFPQIVVHNAK
ncbi:MAG: mechanosensitive ion channel family protein [Lachnospiraceae bacterium]|nr:mechanosensitive ion channel family protein [Lachnospiraceae bacterium]